MRFELQKLTLAKRYLWSGLIVALFPLVIMAVLYDRYSANLLDSLITNKVEGRLESVAVKMNNFISVHVKQLENIVDLPDTTRFFLDVNDGKLSGQLSDFLILETESPDIYSVEFSDTHGNVLRTIPSSKSRSKPLDHATLPIVQHKNVEILGPVLPSKGRPGWFLIRMPVYFNHEKIGQVALRTRLASLTEQAASLLEPNVYEPQVVIFDRIHISAVGTASFAGEILATSRQIMPGWRIHLVERGGRLDEPRVQIRYILLLVATLSTFGVVWLFIRMSQRLTSFLLPLSEGAQAISNGNFSLRVSENGPGELGILARSFNKMSSQLGAMIKSRVDVERRATLGNMAAGIAHEVRNPLATIVTTVHGLSYGESNPERQKMYQVISDEITRVDDTIGEFIKYAKPRKPSKEMVLIRDVFRSVRTLTAATAHDQNVVFNLLGDSALEVEIDHAHLRQILLNLTLNAIQALPDGGHVTLRTHRDGENAEISVTDNGIGLDNETRDKVLRPFFTTRVEGTGLGLSITSQLVEANNGKLDIESELAHGTTVKMIFPIRVTGQR